MTIGMQIGIAFVVAWMLCHQIRQQMQIKQAAQQELQITLSKQHVTNVISLLESEQEGDHLHINRSNIKYPQVGEAYAMIRNEEHDLLKQIYYGDSPEILAISIGQYTESGIPGEGKPILLAGHNGSHFKQLRTFKKGDLVTIDTEYGTFKYEVTDMEIMPYYDFKEETLQEDKERLIMYCCYPFDSLQTNDRYFVYAKKVEGPQIVGDGPWKE